MKGAKVIDASHFESEYILGRKLAFYCKAQGTPRPHITWLKDGLELYAHPFYQVDEQVFMSKLFKSFKLILIILGSRTQSWKGYNQIKNGDRSGNSKRLRFLRMPG